MMLTKSRAVALAVLSREQGEGMGAKVRRSIGSSQLRNLDPFLMLDEFFVRPPAGFPDHPHRGFETVTYMLEGSFKHEDFAGHRGTINAGDLQWMTAGKGIVHAEMPNTSGLSHGLQLWVNLPRSEKLCEPRYQELPGDNVPLARPVEAPGVRVKVIAGESFGVKSAVLTKTPIMYLDFQLEANTTVCQPIPSGFTAFAYLLSGRATFGDDGVYREAHYTLVLGADDSADHIKVCTGGESGAHFVLICGQPIKEPIVQYGPFVMTSQQEIEQTFLDFQSASNGFERAKGWKSEIGRSLS